MADEDTGVEKEIELTAREIAIAQGKDPDAVEEADDDEALETSVSEGEGSAKATDGDDGTDADADSWVTDDLLRVAESYGLGADDLADFGSEAEFNRAARFFEGREVQPAEETKQPAGEEKEGEVEGEQADDDLELDPDKMIEQGYSEDDDAVKLARVLKKEREQRKSRDESLDKLKSEFDEFKQQAAQEQQRAAVQAFDREVDKLVADDLFGSGEELTAEQLERRGKLWDAAVDVEQRILRRDPSAKPDLSVLLKRAVNLEFGEEIEKRQAAERAKKAKAQSGKRRQVGRSTSAPSTRTTLPGDSDDPISAIANHPEVVAAYKEAESYNG